MSRRRIAGALVALTTYLLGGCASAPTFADRPIVWRVDDQNHIEEPEEREHSDFQTYADLFFMRAIERALEVRDLEHAHNVNALDEVPNSTWFENRIGAFALSPERVRRGATEAPPKPPYSVKSVKSAGTDPGFLMEDAEGRSFLIKFDDPDFPEMQSGNDVVVSRLFWALGYHVPSDHVIVFERDDLRLSDDATFKDPVGDDQPLTWERLDALLAQSPRRPDGAIRALASQWLPGKPKGGHPAEGVRDDDPNDTIPHEHRRELRGLRVFSAWVDHTDMGEVNSVDAYVEEGGKKFLRHYLVDFGETLGGHKPRSRSVGYQYYWDWEQQTQALFAVGAWIRPWETIDRTTPFDAVGNFTAVGFDPRLWKEQYPYYPFSEMTRADAFWAAKILIRLRREHIDAAIDAARFSNPAVARYLADTLVRRRDIIGRVYLDALTALDHFTIRGEMLCAVDLMVHYGLASRGTVEVLDDEDVVASETVDESGRVCVRRAGPGRYGIERLRIRRGETVRPVLQVHIVDDRRVVGLIRDEDA